MTRLELITKKLGSNVSNINISNPNVSNSTVGWQIEHALITINLILDALKNSDPNTYKKKFNLNRAIIFTLNKIPRGRAKAPKVVQPTNTITKESIEKQLSIAFQNFIDIKNLDKNCNFQHPYFKLLNVKQTIKFLEIHTNHHLQIVNDIVKGNK